jgi:MerR family transcriptional regulator, copper efflux regulator
VRLTIGGVAEAAGVSAETVRFYERQGLVAQPPRPARGHRQYPVSSVGRIRFIKRAQELGFTLREIHELVALQESPTTDCDAVCRLAQLKIEEVDGKLEDLSRIRAALDGLVKACGDRGRVQGCAILESLEGTAVY